MPDVLDEIRITCSRVSDEAKWVHIDHERLAEYADAYPHEASGFGEVDPGRTRAGDDEATASFVIALDAINFGSGYFPYIRKRPGMSGYFTIATSLRDHVDAHGPITTTSLREMDAERCARDLRPAAKRRRPCRWSSCNGSHRRSHTSPITSTSDTDRRSAELVRSADRIRRRVGARARPDRRVPRRGVVPRVRRRRSTSARRSPRTTSPRRSAMRDSGASTTSTGSRCSPTTSSRTCCGLTAYWSSTPRSSSGSSASKTSRRAASPRSRSARSRCTPSSSWSSACGSSGFDITSGQLDSWLWTRGGGDAYKAIARHRTRCVYY